MTVEPHRPEAANPFDVLTEDAGTTVLCFDFDGCLAPIVDDPASARAEPGAVEVLARLAELAGRVVVISGRPRSFLAPLLPDSVDVAGLYGLERRTAGEDRDHPDADRWRAVIDDVATRARDGGPVAMVVEDKGLSMTLHYRNDPSIADDVAALAESIAADTGLGARPAKMSVELHPPIDTDKGSVVRDVATGASAVLYVGDDLGDLPAFRAVRALGDEGSGAVTVAVGDAELPSDLRDVADVVYAAPAELVDALGHLASMLTD